VTSGQRQPRSPFRSAPERFFQRGADRHVDDDLNSDLLSNGSIFRMTSLTTGSAIETRMATPMPSHSFLRAPLPSPPRRNGVSRARNNAASLLSPAA